MYSNTVVKIESLGKCFQMYKKPHERLLQSVFFGKKTLYKNFWALHDITFHLEKGETVGIVGRNGSGKTTLLQLICGTLSATEGKCSVNGKIAALLALGAGFNPEYSGEDNVYLYASLLGLSEKKIKTRFNDICEFADIGDFISQPVKKYSSGMYMRLAFSVAIHVEPDILIVDEALAVGDEAFQRKCYARLEELKNNGMALLFVSHSASSIINLCDRAILLEKGELLVSGQPNEIISAYHKLLFSPASKIDNIIEEIKTSCNLDNKDHKEHESNKENKKQKAYYIEGMQSKSIVSYEPEGAEITNPHMMDMEGNKVNVLCKGEEYHYTYKVNFNQTCHRVRFGMLIKTITGIEVGGFGTSSIESPINEVPGKTTNKIIFTFVCRLNPGVYFLNAGAKGVSDSGEEIYLHRILDALMIRVMAVDEQQSTGIIDFEISSKITAI